MGNTIRAFIAIPLSPEIRTTIAHAQDNLKTLDCNIKWVDSENTHLTLKFLGDVKLKKIEDVKNVLDNISEKASNLHLQLTTVGAFPGTDNPRILWIGLNDPDSLIEQLAMCIENECAKIGFKKEKRPFSPHITIGRTRSPRNIQLLSSAISDYEMLNPSSEAVNKIILYKSTLTASGPTYEPLKEYQLNDGFVI